MYRLNRRLPWRVVATAFLAAPTLSLLAAAVVLLGPGRVLSPSLPLGMHTLVPVALLVPMPVLMSAAAIGLVLAALTYACTFARAREEPLGPAQAAVVVLATQALLLAAQLVVVWQVNGIPDAALSLVAAVVLQAVVLTVAMGAAVAASLVLVAVPARVRVSTRLAPPPRPATPLPGFVQSRVYRLGTRRGPPLCLLSS